MIATQNIPLNVPYKEKDEAKSHGARWNPAAKHWYIPEGVDDEPFAKWLDGAPEPSEMPAPKPQQAKQASTKSTSSEADLDDINAMLRDAYEDDAD